MKICVISDEHFPHKGADTEVIINTAAALGAAGAEVHLLTPHLWWKNPTDAEVRAYYGVSDSFTHHRVFNPFPPERVARSQQLAHGLSCLTSPHFWDADVVHTRDHAPLALAHLARRPWCYETYRRHAAEKPRLASWLRRVDLARGVGVVCHTERSRLDAESLGFAPEATLTARAGFNLENYTRPAPLPESRAPELLSPPLAPDAPPELHERRARERVRASLRIPLDAPVVGYTGNISAGKGVEACVEAIRGLPEAHLLVVGGGPDEVARFERLLDGEVRERVRLVGHVPSALVPHYMAACDVLMIPPFAQNKRGALLDALLPPILPGTPLKIYGYWAARRLCVAADQPHNTELLKHMSNALIYDHARPEAAAEALRWALAEPARFAPVVARAYEEVQGFTYARRAERMLAFYERRLAALSSRLPPKT
jgi:glycosyltransferase involved in cell wall biosynthesis